MNPEVVASQASASTGRVAPFGKYLLLQRVSVGGMAEVYKAIPEGAARVDQIVAIKRILPNIAEDREFIGMFVDEARVAGLLDHPNICRIYELGKVNGDHYIAMQFLWGRDLLKVMNRYKKAGQLLPAPMAALVAARACAALHYAHTKRDADGELLNIIHRDVSPQNIVVGYAGQTKLIDFGVARAATQSQKTQAGILKGKFGYMSPEMIRGLPVDHRSDVFAMGICLHEALTGARLFYGETDFATLELVRDARVKPPSASAPHVPPELDAIVLRALARDVDQRFPSAGAMSEALLAFLAVHHPGYGEADVAAQMRMAFAQEVGREKHRLDTYTRMLSAGALVRGASIPALNIDAPPSGERQASAQDPIPPALTRPAPMTEEELKRLSGEHDLHESETQIFFSATELDQLRELSQGPALSSPELGSVYPPAPGGERAASAFASANPGSWAVPRATPAPEAPSSWQGRSATPRSSPGQPTGNPPSGGFPAPLGADAFGYSERGQRGPASSPGMPAFGSSPGMPAFGSSPGMPATALSSGPVEYPHAGAHGYGNAQRPPMRVGERHIETEALRPAYQPNRSAAQSGILRQAVFGMAVFGLAALGYFVTRSTTNSTATITIEDVGDPDALVRLDGIVRGNPPLTVEGLHPGVHMLELQAAGSEMARTEVSIESGETRSVRLVLTPQAVPPSAQPHTLPAQTTAPSAADANGTQLAPIAPEPVPAARLPRRPKPVEDTAEVSEGDALLNSLAPGAEAPVAKPAAVPEAAGSVPEAPMLDPINAELAATNQGELLISTVPWSHVYLDGTDTGRDTPIRALRVPAGTHMLGLRTPDGELHELPISVDAGKTVRIVQRF